MNALGRRILVSRIFAFGSAVLYPAVMVYVLYNAYPKRGPVNDVAGWNYFIASLIIIGYFLPWIILSLVVYRHTSDMLGAARKGEVFFLRKLNSTGLAATAVVFSNPVTGIILLASRGRIGRLRIPPDVPYGSGPLLSVDHLVKYFNVRRTFSESVSRAVGGKVHAVDDVSFQIQRSQVFGLAGESGSGKTTVLRTTLALTSPTGGSVIFKGKNLLEMSKGERAYYRRKVQIVFQDPYESVNPRMTVFDIVAEGLFVNNLVSSKEEAVALVTRALKDVQLAPAEEYMARYPHELSGGQRQRVAIARAVVLDPELILADEPVSMLDVSIRAEVINTLLAVRQNRGVSIMMVTHDLALSKDIVDELAIMYVGKIVETGQAGDVVAHPYHPYTRALTAAVPVPDPEGQKVMVLAKGEIPTNVSPPSGCRFHPRCPFAQAICAEKEPPLEQVAPGRKVACHFWREAHEAFEKGMDKPIEGLVKS